MKVYGMEVDPMRSTLSQVALPFSLAIAVFTAAAGCGRDDWQAKTYPASGRITVNGQSPEGAVVTLHPVGEAVDQRGSNPWGIVGADGTFSLSTYERDDGAPAGQYAVTVRWPADVTDMAAAMVDRLGGAYASKDRSQFQVTVEQQETELPPIEILGARVKSERDAQSHRRALPLPGMAARKN